MRNYISNRYMQLYSLCKYMLLYCPTDLCDCIPYVNIRHCIAARLYAIVLPICLCLCNCIAYVPTQWATLYISSSPILKNITPGSVSKVIDTCTAIILTAYTLRLVTNP